MAEGAKVASFEADVEGCKARHQTCDGEMLPHDDAVTFCPCLRVSSLVLVSEYLLSLWPIASYVPTFLIGQVGKQVDQGKFNPLGI